MKPPYIFFIAIILIILTSCGSNPKSENLYLLHTEQTDSVTDSDTNATIPFPYPVGDEKVYYVNKNVDDPYNTFHVSKSITEALKNIEEDMEYNSMLGNPFSYEDVTLIIQTGVYGTESNETYPLIFPANMTIRGEGNVTIKNLDYLTDETVEDDVFNLLFNILALNYEPLVKLGNNTIVDSINLYAGNGIGATVEDNTSAILKNSNIFKCKIGIKAKDNAKIIIMNTDIHHNDIGIETSNNSEAIIKGVKIVNNKIGVKSLQSSKLQFTDKNRITNNTLCGLYDRGTGSDLVLSDQIEWKVQKIFNVCQNGVSIASDKNRNIIFQSLPEYIKLFSNVPEIELIYPKHKSAITTTSPNIKWIPTPENINTKVMIFDSIPIVNNNRIINTENIVWYWNSKSNPKKLGYVSYKDGQYRGKLLNGKGYYYVVLEMNESQTKVTAASSVNFFTVMGSYTK